MQETVITPLKNRHPDFLFYKFPHNPFCRPDLTKIRRLYIGGIERGERNIAALNLIRIAKLVVISITEGMMDAFPSMRKKFEKQEIKK